MGKKRILGNDRFLMFLCKDARRRWMQYGENRKEAQKIKPCQICKIKEAEEWDHVIPLGKRPRILKDLPRYLERLISERCQGLCRSCHLEKTARERKCKKVV